MGFSFSDTDKAVQEYLNAQGVKYSCWSIGTGSEDKWEFDKFTVSFSVNSKSESFEYCTGTGHRVAPNKTTNKMPLKEKAELDKHRVLAGLDRASWVNGNGFKANHWVVAPTAAGVLYSLLSDMTCGSGTFEDFCGNLGYDEDSRKAHDIYLACQKSGSQLRKVFTREQIEQLQELLQDY